MFFEIKKPPVMAADYGDWNSFRAVNAASSNELLSCCFIITTGI